MEVVCKGILPVFALLIAWFIFPGPQMVGVPMFTFVPGKTLPALGVLGCIWCFPWLVAMTVCLVRLWFAEVVITRRTPWSNFLLFLAHGPGNSLEWRQHSVET